ncbi:MAG: V-type ATP synthase subunit E family protein [Saccharofermentanales bacterium]
MVLEENVKGLESIKERILSQAAEQVTEIEQSASRQAQELLAAADKDAEDFMAASAVSDNREKEALILRERSYAMSEARKIVLSAKQELIDKVIDEAVDILCNIEYEKKKELYFDILKKNIKGKERVRFSEADTDIGKSLCEGSELDFSVDDIPGDFKGGLVIYAEQIEINMTFEMLVRQNRSKLVKIAANELFKNVQ